MLSVALPLLVLVLVVSSSLLLQSRERSQRGSNLVTAQINATSATVLLDALNAETGIRGFASRARQRFSSPITRRRGAASRTSSRCVVRCSVQLRRSESVVFWLS